jgi:hypothetical protein
MMCYPITELPAQVVQSESGANDGASGGPAGGALNGDTDRDVNGDAGKGRHKLSGGRSEPGGHCGASGDSSNP